MMPMSKSRIVLNSESEHLRIYQVDGDVDLSHLVDFSRTMSRDFPAIKFVVVFVSYPFEVKNGTVGKHTLGDGRVVCFSRVPPDTDDEQLYRYAYEFFPEEYFPSLDPPVPKPLRPIIVPTDCSAGISEDSLHVTMDSGKSATPVTLNIDLTTEVASEWSRSEVMDKVRHQVLEMIHNELYKNFDRYVALEVSESVYGLSGNPFVKSVRVKGSLDMIPKV